MKNISVQKEQSLKVLIIDNGSSVIDRILQIVDRRHDFDVVKYDPAIPLSDDSYDAIILSGGMTHEVVDTLNDGTPYFRHQFELIRKTNLPILGICLGLQMVTVALGGSLKRLPELIEVPDNPISLNAEGRKLLAISDINVFEKHQWAADSIEGTGLRVLSESEDCLELLYYPERNIVLTQFHPEDDTMNDSLFWKIFELSVRDVISEQATAGENILTPATI